MSRLVSIDIEFRSPLAPIESLSDLLRGGWGFGPERVVTHLPLRDEGMFAWQDAPQEEWSTLLGVFEQKVRRGEAVGVDLFWGDTSVGASFIFDPDGTLTVDPLGNRPLLEGCGPITDMSWFLVRALPPLVKSVNPVLSVCCRDVSS